MKTTIMLKVNPMIATESIPKKYSEDFEPFKITEGQTLADIGKAFEIDMEGIVAITQDGPINKEYILKDGDKIHILPLLIGG